MLQTTDELMLRQSEPLKKAVEAAEQAVETDPSSAEAQLQLARTLFDAAMEFRAEAAVLQALELEPDSPDALQLLGNVLQRLGRFDEAAAVLRRTIEVAPRRIRPYVDLLSCKRVTDEQRPMLDLVASILRSPGITMDDRRDVQYALGKAYDDLGEYRLAMRAFDEANGIRLIQLGSQTLDRKRLSASYDRMIETCSREFLTSHRDFGVASDMPILVVGMIRSGTTLVEQIVSSHPLVSAGGELDYLMDNAGRILNPAEGAPHREEASKVAAGYLELLGEIGQGKPHVTDKMPHNFIVLGLVHLMFPNARIVHCRRNPVDTCISIYTTPFPEALDFAHDPETIVFFYKEYLRMMEHWRKVLPPDRFLEVDYEALIDDREAQTRQMVAFCGLEWDDACLHHERNQGAIQTPSWWQARQPVYRSSINRRDNYAPWLGAFRAFL